MESAGHLVHNLLLFGRLLRGLGLDVSPGAMIDLVKALQLVPIGRRADFYHTARSLLVRRRDDIPLFDEAFEAFWRRPSHGRTALDLRALGERRRFQRPQISSAPAVESAPGSRPDVESSADEEPRLAHAALTYSAQEVLRHRDFAELTGPELEQVRRLMAEMRWGLGERKTRRYRAGRGARLDLRRTLQRSLRQGGEPLRWARRETKVKPRPLVVLADISGSMESYTRLLLLFLYTVAGGLERRVEAFVFGTRLTRITRQLRGRDVERALGEVTRVVPDWSGGTRIGDALRVFNFRWGRRVLGRGAVVLLISDGWDCGDADLLRDEMARLQRSSHRLIWLNPLLGSAAYEPLTRGMRTALPFVDDFLPVHNLASLESLAARLLRIDARRPARAQRPRTTPSGSEIQAS